MTMDKYLEQVKEWYAEYWNNDEIDVDLANQLVDSIPKLIACIEKLKNQQIPESKGVENVPILLVFTCPDCENVIRKMNWEMKDYIFNKWCDECNTIMTMEVEDEEK